MPAIIVPDQEIAVPVPTTQGIFERGDHVYIQTPVQKIAPKSEEIEEYAFASAVRSNAPNENIVWFQGRYVEADRANANGAQWSAQELAIKSLTPMLMPVTVMHDPRTAVGTIADVKHLTPENDGVPRARIETVLALWGHRFPEATHEAEINASQGALMQSMECYSPWYECSECGQIFHKLPRGAEQANWCDHLKASNPNAGYVDLAAQSSNASRVLGDVCFTGTGLIFGSRGARGAYSEAHLESWEDEVASFHASVHSSTSTSPRSTSAMGVVQIEQSELDVLRKERDDARAEVAQEKDKRETAEREAAEKIEQAEAAKTQAETARDAAIAEKATLEEQANRASLKEQRWGKLGAGFTAKLGEFTKGKLSEQAGTLSDDDWDNRLKEVEELTAVKRDATADGQPSNDGDKGGSSGDLFSNEEIAAARLTVNTDTSSLPSRDEQRSVIGSLAGAFSAKK